MDTPSLDVAPATGIGSIHSKAPLRERVGTQLLARLSARRRLGVPLERVPENLHRTARQLALGLELVEEFRAGRYRAISWGALAVLSGALLYAVSPGDVLPDAMQGLGRIDDAVVLALATRIVRRQLEAYCEFKGYSWDEYFSRPTKPRSSTPVTVEQADMPAF